MNIESKEFADYLVKRYYKEAMKRNIIEIVIDTIFRAGYLYVIIKFFPEVLKIFT